MSRLDRSRGEAMGRMVGLSGKRALGGVRRRRRAWFGPGSTLTGRSALPYRRVGCLGAGAPGVASDTETNPGKAHPEKPSHVSLDARRPGRFSRERRFSKPAHSGSGEGFRSGVWEGWGRWGRISPEGPVVAGRGQGTGSTRTCRQVTSAWCVTKSTDPVCAGTDAFSCQDGGSVSPRGQTRKNVCAVSPARSVRRRRR